MRHNLRIETKLAFGGLLLNFLSALYATYSHQPLFGDGSFHVYSILENAQTFHVGAGRYLTDVLQLPALMLRLADSSMGSVVRTYEAVISLHPFVSLIVCFFIAKKRSRLDLMVFPLLSFALSTQFSQAFSFGTVHEVLSLFWPAMIYFLTVDGPNLKDEILIGAILIAFAFTHEASISCLAIFILFSTVKLRARPSRFYYVTLVAGVFVILWHLIKLWIFKVFIPSEFFEPDFNFSNSFPIVGLLTLGFLGVSLALKNSRYSKYRIAFAGAAVLLPLLFAFGYKHATVLDARNVRALSVPLAAFLALFTSFSFHSSSTNRRAIYLATTALLITGSVRNFNITKNWESATQFVQQQVREKRGFVKIQDGVWETEIHGRGMRIHTLPLLSFLLFLDKNPETILYSSYNSFFCEELKKNNLAILPTRRGFRLTENYFTLPKGRCEN